ncbi:MAG: glycerate kinase [Actinomycetota bacterium]|nr:glycerate kinase [Actinomycetota bacterium]
MAHVVVAPDKFKGSLTAAQVAASVATGISRVRPGTQVRQFPVADGGDGTLEAAIAAGFERVPVTATGPTGEPVETAFARRDDVAVVELASVSGLAQLPGGKLAPLDATSRGTGDVIIAALEAGCSTIVLGLGGSACTDGGAGMVQAMGARLRDVDGEPLAPGGAALRGLGTVNIARMHPAVGVAEFVLAVDVDNPLLGPTGAAATYGPQKGATPADVQVLEDGLATWSSQLRSLTDHDVATLPGAGAAGGVGFAAMAVLGAVVRPGIEYLLELLGFDEALRGAGLVITGEGSLDSQSLHGKAPIGVASAAAAAGCPTVAVAGRVAVDEQTLADAGIAAAYALTDVEPDVSRCIAEAGPLLEQVAERLAADWLEMDGSVRSAAAG